MNTKAVRSRAPGVSVVVTCHNSARRLPETLAHLARQVGAEDVAWEVIVVDNASTDDTAAVALACWPEDSPVPFRVVREPRAGSTFARLKGLNEARYEIISLIDDDNWVCPEWVQVVVEVMSENPSVGACGGMFVEACEVEPPLWFEQFKRYYVIGPQADEAGVIPGLWVHLATAGMSLRRAAWRQLIDHGFEHLLAGRQGASLAGNEDVELCYALRLAGWKLWYEPRLKLRHFIPTSRLSWAYLRRQRREISASTVGLDPYCYALLGMPTNLKERLRWTWQWQALSALKALLRYGPKAALSLQEPMEGDLDVVEIERLRGRMWGLLRSRQSYRRNMEKVLSSPWLLRQATSD